MLPWLHSLIHLSPQCDARIIGLVQSLTFAMVSLPIRLVSTMVAMPTLVSKTRPLFVDMWSLSNTTKSPQCYGLEQMGEESGRMVQYYGLDTCHHIPIPQCMGKLFSTCLLNNLINFEDSISNNNNIPEHSKKFSIFF